MVDKYPLWKINIHTRQDSHIFDDYHPKIFISDLFQINPCKSPAEKSTASTTKTHQTHQMYNWNQHRRIFGLTLNILKKSSYFRGRQTFKNFWAGKKSEPWVTSNSRGRNDRSTKRIKKKALKRKETKKYYLVLYPFASQNLCEKPFYK